jgi:hypothetical protein
LLVKPSTSQLGKFDFSKIKRKITNQMNITRDSGDLDPSPRNSPRGSERSDEGLSTNKRERRDTATGKKEKDRRGTDSPRGNVEPSPRGRVSEGQALPDPPSLGLASSQGALSPRQKERRNASTDIWSISPRGSDAPLSPRTTARLSENGESPRCPRIGKPTMVSSVSSPNLIAKQEDGLEKERPLTASVSKTQPLFRKPSNNNFRINLISSTDGVDSPETGRSPRDFLQTTPRSPRLEMSSNRLRFVSEGNVVEAHGPLHINLKTIGSVDEPSPTSLSTSASEQETPTEPHTPKALPLTPKDRERLNNSACDAILTGNVSLEKDVMAPEHIKVLSPRAVRILKPESGARARFCSDGHYDEEQSSASNRLIRSPRSPRKVNEMETVRAVTRVREMHSPRALPSDAGLDSDAAPDEDKYSQEEV